jgi:hypothetical protein
MVPHRMVAVEIALPTIPPVGRFSYWYLTAGCHVPGRRQASALYYPRLPRKIPSVSLSFSLDNAVTFNS